ncbi:hypothetical protein SO694_00146070 [Aureococcus anophagefferens]|uniref:Uncharacterized protein n=1 Tax=Aureococcus anophagefferens TaxID=44056 RepID=A0ABR1FNE7_AURAN
MPPSIAMEGYLEKRIQRPFGIVKKGETKRYLYESVVLAPFSAAPKGRVAFALLDAEEQETKLTPGGDQVRARPLDPGRRRGPGGRERRGAEAQGAAPAHGGVLRRAAAPAAAKPLRRQRRRAPKAARSPRAAASRAVNAPAPAAAAKPGPAPEGPVEVEFVRGPLGLMFDDLAGSSNRAVITGTTETGEHFACGARAAPRPTPADEEKLAQYEKMVRMGCPAGGAMIKARTDGVDAAHLAELERRFAAAGKRAPPPAAAAAAARAGR